MGLSRRRFLQLAGATGIGAVIGPVAGSSAAIGRRRQPIIVIDAPTNGTDATATILRQIAAAPDGSTIVFRPGRYRCEGSLVIQNRVGLTIEGPATFYAIFRGALNPQGYSQRRHWWFIGCRNITLRGLRVESTNTRPDQMPGFGAYAPQWEFEHGFAIHESSNVVVTGCSTMGTWGDGLYIGNSAPSTDVTVDGLVVEFNGRQGVGICNADRVLLKNINIKNTRRAGFDLEPSVSSWHVRHVEIANCSINGYHDAFASLGNGDVSDIYLHHNSISGPGVPWVYVAATDGTRRTSWTIEDNRVLSKLGSPVAALRFANVDNISIRRNTSPIANTQSRLPIEFVSCRGRLEVRDNDFRDANVLYRATGSTAPVIASGNRLTV